MEEKQTLQNIKLEISLEEYFSLSYWRRNDPRIVISEERFLVLSKQKDFDTLVHVYAYEVEGIKLYRLEKMSDYIVNSQHKAEVRKNVEIENEVAKSRHQTIEDWKRTARLFLTKKKIEKSQIESLIIRAMNPNDVDINLEVEEKRIAIQRNKKFADLLEYPYREENNITSNE